MGIFGGGFGTMVGAGAGFLLGGPGGMALGASLGSGLDGSAEAERSRDWQTDFAKHRYQYAVGDMIKAGLNPMLAYSQGGATAPGAATAHPPDISSAAGVAQQGPVAQSQVDLNRVQVENVRANTAESVARAAVAIEQAKLTSAQATSEGFRPAQIQTDTGARREEGLRTEKQRAEIDSHIGLMTAQKEQAYETAARIIQEIEGQVLANTASKYDLVRRRREKEMHESDFGGLKPYGDAISPWVNSASGLLKVPGFSDAMLGGLKIPRRR